jgi:hypothetical protein
MPRISDKAAVTNRLRQSVAEALADTRPNVPARAVLKRLRKHHAVQCERRAAVVLQVTRA